MSERQSSSNDRTLDRSFDYDQVGRLTDAYTGSEAQATIGQNTWGHPDGMYAQLYAYDKYGNITQRQGWGGWNASYTANYTNNKRDGLTYDAAGNVINDGGQAFTYDVNNKMITSSWNGLQQGYDGDGQRVRKQEGGQTTYYLRSSALGGQVICEINGFGVWQKGYVYMGGQMLAVQQYDTVSFVHQDPVTKSQRMTDTSGNLVANSTIELDPFGGETSRTSNNRQSHVFTSYERDAVGMDEAGARKYHGWWSRFDQPDPYDGSYDMGDPQSFNRYSYVQNDPVNFVDPSGLDWSDDAFAQMDEDMASVPNYGEKGRGYGIEHSMFGSYGGSSFNMSAGSFDLWPGEGEYEQRVMHARFGYGFLTNDEYDRASSESFQMQYWLYSDGTYVIEQFHLSPINVSARLAWHQRGIFGQIGDFSRAVANEIIPFGIVDAIHNSRGEPAVNSAASRAGSGVGLAAGLLLPGIGEEATLGHIFRNAVGHVNPGTISSMERYLKLFENVASNPANLRTNYRLPLAAQRAGVEVYTQAFRNGEQVWVYVRNNKIINGGVNLVGAHR